MDSDTVLVKAPDALTDLAAKPTPRPHSELNDIAFKFETLCGSITNTIFYQRRQISLGKKTQQIGSFFWMKSKFGILYFRLVY